MSSKYLQIVIKLSLLRRNPRKHTSPTCHFSLIYHIHGEGSCKIRISDEKAEEFCADEAAFVQMATGFLCYRMDEGTKFFAVAHPLLRRFP